MAARVGLWDRPARSMQSTRRPCRVRWPSPRVRASGARSRAATPLGTVSRDARLSCASPPVARSDGLHLPLSSFHLGPVWPNKRSTVLR